MKLFVYIDESGTLGFKKDEPYFVIAALVIKEDQKKPLKNLVSKMKKKFGHGKPLGELHATEMQFNQKQYFFNLLKNKKYQYQYFVAEKSKIEPSLFANKSVCFNYFIYLFLRNLLERKDVTELDIVIDMRNVKVTSVDTLEDYLQLKLVECGDYETKVYVKYGDSKDYNHLQVVDLMANAVFAKYNWGKEHFHSCIRGACLLCEHFPQYRFETIDKK